MKFQSSFHDLYDRFKKESKNGGLGKPVFKTFYRNVLLHSVKKSAQIQIQMSVSKKRGKKPCSLYWGFHSFIWKDFVFNGATLNSTLSPFKISEEDVNPCSTILKKCVKIFQSL